MGAIGTELEVQPWKPGHLLLRVQLYDSQHPKLQCTFGFIEYGTDCTLYSLTVEATAGSELEDALTASAVRELPLANWSRIAQARARDWLQGPEASPDEPTSTTPDLDDHRTKAESVIRHMLPDLDPKASKAATRKWESLVRYATVLSEYDAAVKAGIDTPVDEIASRHNVAPATVRSWLFRGREAGILEAQREMARGSNHPQWVDQLNYLRKQQSSPPGYEEHSRISLEMQLLHSRDLISTGAAMQKRRELRDLPEGSERISQLEAEIRKLDLDSLNAREKIDRLAEALKGVRYRMKRQNLRLPLITRWIGSVIGESSESSFIRYAKRNDWF
jgi:hypothetical protein